jgi:hypothetical protein
MRTVMSSLVLSALALGLAGEARAGVLSDLVGAIPLPGFSVECLEPTSGDDASSPRAGAPAPSDRRESVPAGDQGGTMDTERARTDGATTPAAADNVTEKNVRVRPNRWKALLPGALK